MAKTYYPTIGLEIHAELKTRTKMFCNSPNNPEERRPNSNICAVCMGHPGTLPVVNKEAVKHVLKVGLAVGGELADYSEFDRKNYFYPDIPKGYQISQYAHPLVTGGILDGVRLTRVHLEEDTAKSFHLDEEGGPLPHESAFGPRSSASLIDFNRAGVPLMELVTEPVITDAAQAVHFAKELQLLLRYLSVADADMEKGQMRVEANISVSTDKEKFGKKVEVKNLNSFRAVERAIAFELSRQEKLIEEGGEVVQETRGWDEDTGETFSQRRKEESHDYRYFPDPDIPKLKLREIKEFAPANLQKEIPELPWKRRARLPSEYGIKKEDAELFVNEPAIGVYFEEVARGLKGDKSAVKLASNYITSDLIGLVKGDGTGEMSSSAIRIKSADLVELIGMISKNEISSRGAKDILKIMFEKGGTARAIAEEKGLFQESDSGALTAVVQKVLTDNPQAVSEYQAGKTAALQFLVGQCMKATKGSGNPAILKELLAKEIG